VYTQRASVLFSAKITERLEQRYCTKFCQKLGDSQVETIWKIHRVFGDDAMGIAQIKEGYIRFKNGRTSVESDARSSRPSTNRNDELIDKVRTLVVQDRRVTIRELAEEVGIYTGSVNSIFTYDLAMRERGSCITTKHRFKLSWPNTTFLQFDRLHTLPTWLIASVDCSST
jgi:hypothetical protein